MFAPQDLPLPELLRLEMADLDPAVNPHSDLDAHVNARWRRVVAMPPDRSCWDSFTVLEERSLLIQARLAARAAAGGMTGDAARVVGNLWASGLGSSGCGVDSLQQEFAVIAGLRDRAAVATYLCDRHARGWPLLFRFEVLPAFDRPREYLACLTPAPLGLPGPELYRDASERAGQLRAHYVQYIARSLVSVGTPDPEAEALARAVLGFETVLAGTLPAPRLWHRDIGLHQRRIRLGTGDPAAPLRWPLFFTALGQPGVAEFSLAVPAFEAAVQSALRDLPLATWQAYLRFQALDSMAACLDDAAAATRHEFRSRCLRGQRALRPRWKRVLDAINAHAGEALGQLYAEAVLSPETVPLVRDLAARLRRAFGRRLRQLDWMTPETRREALRKLEGLRFKIGAPAPRRDWSSCAVSRSDWHGNLAALRALDLRERLAKLEKPVDAEEWSLLPQTVNARYDPQRNDVTVPAALLQPPFFDPAAPAAANYGGIGAVIAHEMTHGYDDRGRRFDAQGWLRDWWSGVDAEQFESRAARLVRHVESLPFDGGRVDGTLTLGENVADFGGLAIACTALRQWLAETGGGVPCNGRPPLQWFFLNWAAIWRQQLTGEEAALRLRVDPHAPAPLRVRAAALDLPDFATAFGSPAEPCPAPAVRAGIW